MLFLKKKRYVFLFVYEAFVKEVLCFCLFLFFCKQSKKLHRFLFFSLLLVTEPISSIMTGDDWGRVVFIVEGPLTFRTTNHQLENISPFCIIFLTPLKIHQKRTASTINPCRKQGMTGGDEEVLELKYRGNRKKPNHWIVMIDIKWIFF